MGQKVSPTGLRVGIIKDWESKWYAAGKDYPKWLHEDIKIREFIFSSLKQAAVSSVEIERTKTLTTIFIRTARPGVVLGQEGKNVTKLIEDIKKVTGNKTAEVKINIVEVKNPDADSQLVANSIAEQIVNRASFRTVQKMAIRKAMKAGAKGIKTLVSGRLGGVEMARTEGYSEGVVPLTTLRSNIDYATAEALTTYGQIGVKVWICKGEVLSGKAPRDIEAPRRPQNRRRNFNNKRK